MNRNNFSIISILLILSFTIAFFAIATSYPKEYLPESRPKEFIGIDHDRWLQDGAEIVLPNLARRGNFIDFHFSSWHPGNYPSPRLQVSVCNQLRADFIVTPSSQHRVYLQGDCQPRVVKLNALSEPIRFAGDSRPLLAQVEKIQLSSRLFFPIPSFRTIFSIQAAILLLVALLIRITPRLFCSIISLFFLSVTYFFINQYYFANFNSLAALTVYLGLFLLGANLSLYRPNSDYEIRLGNNYTYAGIGLIFIFAALLRFYQIDFGLPANFHPDEVPKYNAIERMRHFGDLNPRYFLHPTLLLYSSYFFNMVLRAITNPENAWMDTLLLAGRMMSASAGSISVILTALIAKRLFGNIASLVAAFLLAIFPLHVTCSRYVKEDSLLVLMILLAVYFVVRSVQEKRAVGLVVAGLFAGFSASVKYSGIVSVMILVAAPFLVTNSFRPDWKFLRWTVIAVLVIPIGFTIASPYTMLDALKFQQDFSYEKSHMSTGHDGLITAGSQLWTYHLSRSLDVGMGKYCLFLSLLGLGSLIVQKRISALYVIALFLLYYIPAEYVRAKPAPQPERYVLPCLPFLAIALSYLFQNCLSSSRNILFRFTISLILFLAILPTAIRTIGLAKELKPDTRQQMQDWINQNVPASSKILIDLPAYEPKIDSERFVVSTLPRTQILEYLNLKKLQQEGADYLLLSSLFYDRYFSQPGIPPQPREIIRGIFKKLKVVKEIEAVSGTYGFHNPRLTLFQVPRVNNIN